MNGKIALGALGGIGLITTVSVTSSRSGSSDPAWAKGIPAFKVLAVDTDFFDDDKNNPPYRFGHKYSGLLVGYSIPDNEEWWKWSYENLKKDIESKGDSLEETFKVSDSSTTVPDSFVSLKNWCKSVYEVDTRSRETSSLSNNKSIWKYCSSIQKAPVSLGVTYPANTLGKEMKQALLDLNKNDRIWHYRNKFFEELPDDFFKTGVSHDVFVQGKKKGRKVRDICADTYKQKIEESRPHDDIMFFCSINQLN